MRILLVAPLVSPIGGAVPLGGAQSVLADLAAGLASRGHDVALVAARGSAVPGVRVVDAGIDPRALRPASFDGARRVDDGAQRAAFARIARRIRQHEAADVIHAHAFDAPAIEMLDELALPVLHTLHLPPVDETVVAAARTVRARLATVSESNAVAWRAAGVRIDAILPNGVDVERIPYGTVGDGALLFAGRLSPEKGAADAIRVARAAGRPLVLAGGPYDPDYVAEAIAPLLGPDVTVAGAVARDELWRLMSRASALLMPIGWDEPFGLVAAEAMAAGSPVVAYRRGGLAEVVRDGVTGILVEAGDRAALVAAVMRVGALDRAACRRHVADSYPLSRMLDLHERLYADVVAGQPSSVSLRS